MTDEHLRADLVAHHEALAKAWRSALRFVEELTRLPIRYVEDEFPPANPAEIAEDLDFFLEVMRLGARRAVPRLQLEARLDNLNMENDALLRRVGDLSAENGALRTALDLAQSRAASVTGFKDRLRALPVQEELKTYLALFQDLADISAPGHDRGGVTPQQIVERVRDRYADHRTLEAELRRLLGLSEYQPVVDNVRHRAYQERRKTELLDTLRTELGVDALKYAADPEAALVAAVRALVPAGGRHRAELSGTLATEPTTPTEKD